MLRFSRYLIITTLLVLPLTLPAQAQTFSTPAKQAILIDFNTGMILYEKNADEKMPTSSMSKTMTIYAVFEALQNGQLRLDDELTVSEKAWKMGGSKMFVEVDKKVEVEDLLRGVIVQSGNDATIVLAEGISGTEEAFAQLITAKAQAIGMTNTNFVNASGWPDPDHYSTARDLATLGRHLIADFPQYYGYFAETEFTYSNIRQSNRNPLLYRDIGADGIKTGHTEDGGYGLMGSGAKGDRRVILVLNGMDSDKTRAQESARMLEWGLKSFENLTLFKSGDIVDNAPVAFGKADTVPLTINEDVLITLPVAVRNDLKVNITFSSPLRAPVKKGTEVGIMTVDIPRVTTLEIPLVTAESVQPLGFFASMAEKIKYMTGGAGS